MKKIDFHMHTVVSSSDSDFEFSLEKLIKYVEETSIDAIAITNHNLFDLDQFNNITSELNDIAVFPGIEVDVDSCHILVIASTDDIGAFDASAQLIKNNWDTTGKSIPVDEFVTIFDGLSKYLVIPHYKKSPSISSKTLKTLEEHITCGEVSSAKKFIRCWKSTSELVPVIFSDQRLSTTLEHFSTGQTYIECGELSFAAIKSCLRDRNKVALSESDGNKLFRVLNTGLMLSTGLNVLLGARSSGKTFTLDAINSEQRNVKYIEQFSLVQGSSKDHEELFNSNIKQKNSSLSEEYLSEFRAVVDVVKGIDKREMDQQVENYISSLKKTASETHLSDIFSKAKLFSETKFNISDNSTLNALIKSVRQLVENIDYRDTIDAHIDIQSLKRLACQLIEDLREREYEARQLKLVNNIIANVNSELVVRSASTQIEDVDLLQYMTNINKINRFEEITNYLRCDYILDEKDVQGYKVIAHKGRFTKTAQIKSELLGNPALSDAFKSYHEPFNYLQKLKSIESLVESDISKCFAKFTYSVLNQDEIPISGGERSEFRLLQEIQDATKYDILLLDEPESSFDNNFLHGKVNALIRDIAKNMPVVVVTHNSTVGGSIEAEYLLYAAKENTADEIVHKIYRGYPTDQELTAQDGSTLKTHDVFMDSLEAGIDAYNKRSQLYEVVKN